MSCDFVARKPLSLCFLILYQTATGIYIKLVLSFPVETLHELGFSFVFFLLACFLCCSSWCQRTQMILNSLWAGLILPSKWVSYPPLTASIGGILQFSSLLPATQQHFAVRCYRECEKDSCFTGPSSRCPACLYLTLPTTASWRSRS